jgi:hypothetical protein
MAIVQPTQHDFWTALIALAAQHGVQRLANAQAHDANTLYLRLPGNQARYFIGNYDHSVQVGVQIDHTLDETVMRRLNDRHEHVGQEFYNAALHIVQHHILVETLAEPIWNVNHHVSHNLYFRFWYAGPDMEPNPWRDRDRWPRMHAAIVDLSVLAETTFGKFL